MITLRLGLLALGAVCCSPAPPLSPTSPLLPPVDVPVASQPVPEMPLATPPEEPAAPPSGAEMSPLETALREWSRKSQCAAFDYFPKGGIQSFWCHRPGRITLASIRALAGVDLFVKGPHGADLALAEASDFGHYNPAFVRWLVESVPPSARGSAAQKATQGAYDANVAALATVFWQTYEKTQNDAACFAREKAAYRDLIAKKKLPNDYYERWFYFMNPYFCDKGPGKGINFYSTNGFDAGVSGNVTKTVIGFWLRRALDGTMETFAAGLKKLLASYQPDLLAKASRFPDPAALTKAVDAGARGASSCPAPAGGRATVHVTVTVAPSGQVSAAPIAPRGAAPTSTSTSCIEQKFSAQQVTPPFDGPALRFQRSITLR